MNRLRVSGLAITILIVSFFIPVHADSAGYQVLLAPDNSFNLLIAKDSKLVLRLDMGGWGPNWAWTPPPTSTEKGTVGKLSLHAPFKIGDNSVNVGLTAGSASANSITLSFDLATEKDLPLTMLMDAASIPDSSPSKGTVTLTADGKTEEIPIPFARLGDRTQVTKAVFHLDSGDITADFDPAISLHLEEGSFRMKLASDVIKAGTTTTKITLGFPAKVEFISSDAQLASFVKTVTGPDWFPFDPTDFTSPSVFAMDDWLDKPAGSHGAVTMDKDQFKFADGTPVRFWGTNLAYSDCAPEKANAEATAARFARYGVNSVRLHKFSGAGWEGIGDPNDATQFDPAGFDKFDYFTSQLTSHGIYYGFSHTYGFKVEPGNKDKLLAYDEIVNNLQGNTYGLINYAEDVQDLMIQRVVNLLKHQNKYTGKTYAEDPALAYVEIQNEDDIFFYTTAGVFQKCPTYAKKLTEQFADWLRAHYGSQEKLAAAWQDALNGGETLDAHNIAVEPNPWSFGDDNLPKKTGGARQRLLDNAQFFHDAQDKFYTKFVKAVRDAGYKGPMVGSPWFAPAMVPLYYNLLSDYKVGYIDRHDYFDGKLEGTMLTDPGSGYLSIGLQQVGDRPFGLSEWIHVYPDLYSAEGPFLVGAYGLGLQGWDASYEFTSQSSQPGFTKSWSPPYNVWHVDSLTQMGTFPAVARMIFRGDVHQSDVISTRNISPEELAEGKFSFSDKVAQAGDVKTITGDVPASALAAGRCVVQFTEKPVPSTFPDMTKYEKGSVITSSTGQLSWDHADKGFFTINTDGTKAVVGFAKDKPQKLGDVSITSHSPYAIIAVTALQRGKTLATTSTALITVMARIASTGMSYSALTGEVLDNGKEPTLAEPVNANITISGRPVTAVKVLDANGKETAQTVPVDKGAFKLDTAKDKTLYYEVVY